MLTQAVSRDWIDQPALVRREKLDPERTQRPISISHDDDRRRLEEQVQRLIDERRATGRAAERVAPPGLGDGRGRATLHTLAVVGLRTAAPTDQPGDYDPYAPLAKASAWHGDCLVAGHE